MDEQWVCAFDGRAGGRARAVFESEEQARAFAERHARAMTSDTVPLKWEDSDQSMVLTSQVGSYRIMRLDAV